MPSALPKPNVAGLITQWTVHPVAIVAAVALAAWYIRSVRRIGPHTWPARRSVGFAAGLALLVWTTSGFPQVYGQSLFWVWTAQALILWLLVPLVLLAGRPLHLAQRRYGTDSLLDRALRSRPCRVLANPLVGPAVVPLLSSVLFFGPLPGWAVEFPVFGWALHLVLVSIGALILLPLVGIDDATSSLAIGLSLAIGMIELVLDAVPGIVLRLNAHISTSYFDHHSVHSWSIKNLHDQQIAGSIVWVIAEVIDLPFLALVFLRWMRADAREATEVDTILEAERISRGSSHADGGGEPDTTLRDAPWWLSDPEMQQRLKRQG